MADPKKTKSKPIEDPEANAVPDNLLAALKEYEDLGLPDTTLSRDRVSVNFRRIELIQDNTRNHPRVDNNEAPTLGKIALVSGAAGSNEAEYVPYLDLLLFDPLFFTEWTLPGNVRGGEDADHVLRRDQGVISGRTMWEQQPDGNRNVSPGTPPLCSTSNGLSPWTRYLGQELPDYRIGVPQGAPPIKHRIGYQLVNGDWQQSAHPCLTCPFADWINESESRDGKRQKPACAATAEFLVYSIDHNEVIKLKGVNGTLQAAIMGSRQNGFGSRYDGAGFPGLMWQFSVMGMFHEETQTTLDLREYRRRYENDLIADPAQWRMLYRNRPQGMPSQTHPEFPIYAVRMTVVPSIENRAGNSPFVTQFTVLDGNTAEVPVFDIKAKAKPQVTGMKLAERKLTSDEITAYLSMRAAYAQSSVRETLMGLSVAPSDPMSMLTGGAQTQVIGAPALNPGMAINAGQPTAKTPDVNVDDPFN